VGKSARPARGERGRGSSLRGQTRPLALSSSRYTRRIGSPGRSTAPGRQ
jgi:hypothetical protein